MKNNKHNYGTIAKACGLRYSTTPPPVEQALKPQPITKEDEERVVKKLAEDKLLKPKRKRYHNGFNNKQEYIGASPESRKRREIIFEVGEEGKRIQAEEHTKWMDSQKKVHIDIVSPEYSADEAFSVTEYWNKDDKGYYLSFNSLYNKGLLGDDNPHILSAKKTIDPKYNYLTNGTHYKGVSKEKEASQDDIRKAIDEIISGQYRRRSDIMNTSLARPHLDSLDSEPGLEDNDPAHRGESTLWIENIVGTEHPEDEMRTDGLPDLNIAYGLVEDLGVMETVRYISNEYAENADFSSDHLIDLNVIRFATTIAKITSAARRHNNKLKKAKTKNVSLDQLSIILKPSSEKVSSFANKYIRELVNSQKDIKVISDRINQNLTKALKHDSSKTTVGREMVLLHYGLILAALFKRVKRSDIDGQ